MLPPSNENRVALTVIVLAQDEAINIRACLSTLTWADDVAVVDSGSSDATLDLAVQALPRVRILQHPFQDFGQQRNWAIDHAGARHEWVLFLDADERSTPEFANAVAKAIAPPSSSEGYYLCYRNFFLGRWIKHSTLFPSWQLRLLRKTRVRFRREGHGQREVADGPLGYLHTPFDHYGFSKGVQEWITRHNRYSTDEIDLIHRLQAEELRPDELLAKDPVQRRRALKRLAARSSWRPVNRFVYLYLWRRGFLDGKAGLLYCLLRAANEIHIVAKLVEREWESHAREVQ